MQELDLLQSCLTCSVVLQFRRLFQIDGSATTVDAAPLVAANASSSILSPVSSGDSQPHSILGDVISAFTGKHDTAAPAPAPVTYNLTLREDKLSASIPFTAAANSSPSSTSSAAHGASTKSAAAPHAAAPAADADDNMSPCSSGPVPSEYEAFDQVCMLDKICDILICM